MRRAVARGAAWASLALVALASAGCEWQEPPLGWSFERMIRQPSYRAFEAAGIFADSMVMRPPPEGTVHRDALVGPAAVLTGRRGPDVTVPVPGDTGSAFGRNPAPYVEEIPVRLTPDDLERGRDRFGIYCAVCHGIDGSGGTPVARNMTLRPPPSLHSRTLREAPDGRIFAVATEGYGFMPSYASELSVADRWAVVGYVRALQLARRARLAELPDSLQRAFRDAVGAAAGTRPPGPVPAPRREEP